MTDDVIEGEAQEVRPPARQEDTPQAVAVFNPLDAEPGTFSKQLASRQSNYDALASHLASVLVPDKDFGKIHVVRNCPNKYNCTNPGHFSENQLFAEGADKVLGILGLGVHYPGVDDYKKAALTGVTIADVIVDAQILGPGDQVIAEGVGAAARSEFKGDLNRTMKRAQKRARVEAVKRLPSISALFQDPAWLGSARTQAQENNNNHASTRTQQVNPTQKWDTGATLTHCPVSKKYKGKPWHEIPTDALIWFVDNYSDRPDIFRAAEGELKKRGGPTESGEDIAPAAEHSNSSTCNPPPPGSTDELTFKDLEDPDFWDPSEGDENDGIPKD